MSILAAALPARTSIAVAQDRPPADSWWAGDAEPPFARRERWLAWKTDLAVSRAVVPGTRQADDAFLEQRVLPVLAEAGRDETRPEWVRTAALEALGETRDPGIAALVEELQEGAGASTSALPTAALLAPLRAPTVSEATRARLLRVAKDPARRAEHRVVAGVVLALLDPPDRAGVARSLLDAALAEDTPPQTGAGLFLALGVLREPATLDGLERRASDGTAKPSVRAWAVAALARVAVASAPSDAERIAEWLQQAVRDPKQDAAWTWVAPDALARLFEAVPAPRRARIVESLRAAAAGSRDLLVAGEALLASGRIAGSSACDAATAARVVEWLRNPPQSGAHQDLRDAAHVALALAASGRCREEALRRLREPVVRPLAPSALASVLAEAVARGPERAPHLARLASSLVESDEVRGTALLALAEPDPRDAALVARDVVREGTDRPWAFRCAARVVDVGGDAALHDALIDALRADNGWVACAAADALGRSGSAVVAEQLVRGVVGRRPESWVMVRALAGMRRAPDRLTPLRDRWPWAAHVPALQPLRYLAAGP